MAAKWPVKRGALETSNFTCAYAATTSVLLRHTLAARVCSLCHWLLLLLPCSPPVEAVDTPVRIEFLFALLNVLLKNYFARLLTCRELVS